MGYRVSTRVVIAGAAAVVSAASCVAHDGGVDRITRSDPRLCLSVSARVQLMTFARHAALKEEPILPPDAPLWKLHLSDHTVLRHVAISSMPRLVRSVSGDLKGADMNAIAVTHPDSVVAFGELRSDRASDRIKPVSISRVDAAPSSITTLSPALVARACLDFMPVGLFSIDRVRRIDLGANASEISDVYAALHPDVSSFFVEAAPVEGGPSIKSRGGKKRR